MLDFFRRCQRSLWHFVYPPHCLHCGERMDDEQSLLCSGCTTLLEFLDPTERCPYCFGSMPCNSCVHGERLFHRMGAVFEYVGPAASLVKKLKYANQPQLAKGLGAFLAIQFDQLKWPYPDVIVPVPMAFTHWIDRGYNQSVLLAQEMANILQLPVWNILKRTSGDYSQAGLTLDQRKKLESTHFNLKKGYSLEDKVVLVVDDVMTSGATLRRCAEALAESHPASLYAITLCKA